MQVHCSSCRAVTAIDSPVTQPVIGAGISLFAYRGCLNQDAGIYTRKMLRNGLFGIYSVNPQGELDDLSVGIDDIFSEKIDWSSKWFIVREDP